MAGDNAIIEDHLLHLITKSDDNSFSKFYHLTSSQLYNAIMNYIKDQAVAFEIMQVCYVRVWEHRQELQHIGSLKDYLFILARNAAFDHFKKVTIQVKLLSRIKHRMVDPQDSAGSVILRLPSQPSPTPEHKNKLSFRNGSLPGLQHMKLGLISEGPAIRSCCPALIQKARYCPSGFIIC
jgi:DNA-directed RNA polymerase specialized sigma24 family protein